MGPAVLPACLATEPDFIAAVLVTGSELAQEMSAHQPMFGELRARHAEPLATDNAISIVRITASDVFVRGLQHCGVFGDDAVGGCRRFLGTLGWIGPKE